MNDLRWKQRFSNFSKALKLYSEAAITTLPDRLSQEGLIQRFEYTFELAWKTLQDLLSERGYEDIRGPRPVLEKAFQDGIIEDGETWLKMLKSRNDTVHLYNEKVFLEIIEDVRKNYLILFQKLEEKLKLL
jgi:nucleotidyltransferase substrate binding protein (TIGR01987 family)